MNTNNDTTVKFTALAGINADKCPVGSRLCKVMYKEEKENGVKTGKKRASLGAFIPSLSMVSIVTTEDKKLAQWIDAQAIAVQDRIIRARLEVKGCEDSIIVPSMDDVIAVIKEDMSRERTRAVGISKEAIATWFVESGMKDALIGAFMERLGASTGDMRVQKVVSAYGENMMLLAGKGTLPDAVLENLVKAMDVLGEHKPDAMEDDMYMKVLEKIEEKGKKVESDLMAL